MSSRCRASPPREAGGCEAAPRIPSASALLGRALCHYCYSFAFFFFFYSPHPIPSRCPAPRRAVLLRAQVAPCAPAGAAPSPLSAEPGREEWPPAPAPPPPPRGAAPPGSGAGGREAGGRSFSGGEGRTRPRGGSPALAMKRKQKRFLQMTLLFTAALIFLPDIGLWSLYREKHLVKPAEPAEPQTVPLGLGDGQLFTWTDGLKRKDWHDYESIQKDAMRSGKGEHGKPYPLTEEDHDDSAYRENGFNIFVSNNIALERSLPDIRHPNCKHKVYLEKLPNTSIIIPFHNEGWTSLLRTIHSIINRTPDSLIAEIILVDDFSDREHLKEKLEEYMVRFAKVRIVRTKKREGLIRTRLLGASLARGEVLTFLDSHCEVNVNWLPPLLNQIALNHKTIVCPMIDVIDHNHFGYEAQAGDAMRGAFDWEMYYKRIPIPPELQRADPSDPFESPVMAGGLFAVNRKWFWELGGYDPGLEIWGGEQYEISFKVWMCGGGMFDVPCSRVGHIYRKYVPYKVPSGTSLARNLKRVAETWMDEFAEYIYQRRPEYRHLSTGDISAQKELRKHLKCKDFKWFMAAVAWDVPKYYPPVEPPPAAWGEIRNVAANLCVDSKHGATGTELRLDICVKDGSERTWSHEQLFTFGWREDIRPGEPLHTRKFCFDAISHSSPVTLYDCHGMKGNQHWSYRKVGVTLGHFRDSDCLEPILSLVQTCTFPSEKLLFKIQSVLFQFNFVVNSLECVLIEYSATCVKFKWKWIRSSSECVHVGCLKGVISFWHLKILVSF